MHKICLGCGKNKLHHGRGMCQSCYRIFMRTGKKLPLPQQVSNKPEIDVNDTIATIEEDSQHQIEEQPIEINQFSRHVDLLVNRLNVKCLRCSQIIEPEVACKFSLIYCGFCYFNKTGKRQKPQVISRVEQPVPVVVANVEAPNRVVQPGNQIRAQPRVPRPNIVAPEEFIELSSGSENEDL